MPGLSNAAFPGELTLVNVWASWCIPCADEVPFLEKLSHDKRIKLVGINYKDPTDNARRFLNRYGNPFVAVGVDASGRTSIDWGVYGVPETYLIGRDGTIVYKLVGPVTAENLAARWIRKSPRQRRSSGALGLLLDAVFLDQRHLQRAEQKRQRHHAEQFEADPEIGGLRAPDDFVQTSPARRRKTPSARSACASLRRSAETSDRTARRAATCRATSPPSSVPPNNR